jgi:thiol:disulfide interchange protein DsbD
MKRLALPPFVLICLTFLSSGGFVAAQGPQTAVFSASITPSPARVGETARLTIQAKIAQGWHLYSLIPTPPPGPSPTTITVNGPGITASSATEDTPITQLDPNFGKQVQFHLGAATFTVPIKITMARLGTTPLKVSINYQTCNSTECLPPRTKTLSVPLDVDDGPARAQFLDAATSPPSSPIIGGRGAVGAARGQGTSAGGLLPFLAAAFLAGLLALLTPCVFPLIPVTFGFFTKQTDGDKRKLIGLASAYAVGIILSFAGLGFVMAITLGAAGANRVAANPWVNLFFGVLFVVFAFSFFEAFNLRLPGFLSRFTTPTKRSGGLVSVLLMGLAFVFAAFTCTAPFIGTVLVAAASASSAGAWLRPLAGMLAFALALALPFFLLALFPGLLSRLPRSGAWLSRFKAVLGFIELAYSLLYFSKADLVWQAGILTRPAIFALWALISLGGMLYLLGLLRVSAYPEESSRLTIGRVIGAVAFALVGIYCLYGVTGRPISGALAAYLPTTDYGPKTSNTTTLAQSDGLTWLDNYQTALAQAKAQNKPILIDFTGYTCTNCRYNELSVFPQPAVKSQLSQYILVRLYTDGGPNALQNQAFEQKRFGTVALPLYALIGSDDQTITQTAGTITQPARFAQLLAQGIQTARAPGGSVTASWVAYTPNAVKAASGKPAIIDFTANWCTVCHQIEKTVFVAPQVEPNLAHFATFKVDLSNFGSKQNDAVEKQFHIEDLPVIVFLDPQGREIPGTRVTGLISARDFAARMAKAEGAPSNIKLASATL